MSLPKFELDPPPPGRLPRLLPAGEPRGLTGHLDRHGPMPPWRGAEALIADVRASGLTGRGGAGFPFARKLAAVVERAGLRGGVAVANGAEGEPASAKDATLLTYAPHLVLDGLALVSRAVRARTAWVYADLDGAAGRALRVALEERRRHRLDPVTPQLVAAPPAFLAGEESAVVDALAGGPGLPTSTPPRVYERGLGRRPTLVSNVETLAHLALVARYGGAWFAGVGDRGQPGTRLYTVWTPEGARVLEGATGTTARQLYDVLGADVSRTQALLVGGYHGAWLPGADALDLPLADPELRPLGASAGAGVVAALPDGVCGVIETARIASYLADESARQCGPCLNALPRIAQALRTLARAGERPGERAALRAQVERWAGLAEGRGACRHPDGTVRLVRSGLRAFAAELDRHASGRCSATRRPFLPTGERW